MPIEVSSVIDLPVADVWRWRAVDHVRNHPRWDPDIQLEQLSDGPMGLGTTIRRLNTRWGAPVEGEMEVVEWEPERSIAFLVRDANMEMRGRATFEAIGPQQTRLTIDTDIPGIDEQAEAFLAALMERSAENVRRLIAEDRA